MLDHNEECPHCGDLVINGPIKAEFRGLNGFAVECESCGARGPWGRDALEAVTRFENAIAREVDDEESDGY